MHRQSTLPNHLLITIIIVDSLDPVPVLLVVVTVRTQTGVDLNHNSFTQLLHHLTVLISGEWY